MREYKFRAWHKKVIRKIHKYFLDVKAFTLSFLGIDFGYFFFDE
jgi:hypothetical protein